MESWLGQYCLNVTDLERSVAFYTSLGLTCTSRTEIEQAWEAIVENPGGGSTGPAGAAKGTGEAVRPRHGFLEAVRERARRREPVFERAVEQGASVETAPTRLERWP